MELFGFDVSVTWVLVVGVVLMLAWYDRWCHQYFQRRGIPVPDYIPFFGNILQWRHGFQTVFTDYAKKYGKVVGTYDFRTPVLIITDPDLLKNILVKNFSSFCNRRKIPLSQRPLNRGLTRLDDEEWKEIRNVITPSFSASKMKRMSAMINECCDTMVTNFSRSRAGGKAVDCREVFGAFTMDVVASCGFGVKVDSQQNKDDPFVKYAKKAFAFTRMNPFVLLLCAFPFLKHVFAFLKINPVPPDAIKFFMDVTETACKMRSAEGSQASKRVDLLQLMLNAHNDDEFEQNGTSLPEDNLNRSVAPRKPLSTEDVMAQSLIFFLAGYETTNTLLSFTAYLLATNQEAQEKLHAEIDNLAPTRDNLGYDVIAKMEYLDMVINESLRMYPPAVVFDRVCNDTVTVDGLTIEKGVHLIVSTWTLHYDEQYWENPSNFDPERFSPENKATIKPCTFLPFGFGPRNCIGMRFALMEAKMALVRVMQQYRFDVSSETENMEVFGFGVSMTLVLVVGTVLIFAWYDWWCHHYFQRRGIPVADYVPVYGSSYYLRDGVWKAFDEYRKKHGKVVGMYGFRQPVLVVSDPEILKHILVKSFSNFYNRWKRPMVRYDRSPVGRGMFFLEDGDWKNIRNTLTPSLTGAKMKQMSPVINECCDTLITSISEARTGGKAVDCKALFGAFTMDVIARCAFGLNVDSQKDKDDPFVQNARIFLDPRRLRGPHIILSAIFPVLARLFGFLGVDMAFDKKAAKFFQDVTEATCKLREEEGATASKERIDLFQLMLNAHNDPGTDPEDTPTAESGPEGGVAQRKPLSTEDIMAQGVQFFLAGYETTNSLLTFTAYLLATNQDVQEKLHAEIDNLAPTRDNLGYDVIAKMEYLDMVISESLRMYPPVIFLDRLCNDTVNCDGFVIEKGVAVFVPVWSLHRDEEYWKNPTKFDPERFSLENKASIKPFTYMPFGLGPRICFGMRFALMEGKMALVRIMQQYRFDVSSETEIPIPLGKGLLLAPAKLMLNVVPRN
ncbi:uncharacterized protein LOC110974856 [Acanthaster planci]|uniref:Thromboxane-A synthase n=1 Tax=Acanthaster planci TaxID=133434 RepID=A0A8B7XQL1_ACAPL|nr:uncharacterized protein LOC110974856 [Acanthaster planci]